MNQNPQYKPTPEQIRKKDEEQLKLLSIFYFVMSGLAFFGLVIVLLQYVFFQSIFGGLNDNSNLGDNVELKVDNISSIFNIFFIIFGLFTLISGILLFLAGKNLRKKSGKMLIMIAAGLSCLQFPLGTVLGVFTFIVLSRSSVQELFEENN